MIPACGHTCGSWHAAKERVAESKRGGAKKAKAGNGVVVEAPPKADAETSSWYKNRPKGGVKVLGGSEGALTGGKRSREDDAAAAAAAQ